MKSERQFILGIGGYLQLIFNSLEEAQQAQKALVNSIEVEHLHHVDQYAEYTDGYTSTFLHERHEKNIIHENIDDAKKACEIKAANEKNESKANDLNCH